MSHNGKTGVLVLSPVAIKYYGEDCLITCTVRYNDDCNNGHKSFAMTADIKSAHTFRWVAGGCLHEEIAKAYPGMAQFIKWHLCSTDGPMHYIENAMYWLGRRSWMNGGPNDPPNLAHARSGAIWPDMPEGYVITGTLVSNATIEAVLTARLPALMAEFRKDVESLGFVY